MPDATPQFDFQKCATPWPVRLTDPSVAVIGEFARVGTIVGMVYSTVQGQTRVGNLLLTCGYGQVLSVAAASGNAITQGEKLYRVDETSDGEHDQVINNTVVADPLCRLRPSQGRGRSGYGPTCSRQRHRRGPGLVPA